MLIKPRISTPADYARWFPFGDRSPEEAEAALAAMDEDERCRFEQAAFEAFALEACTTIDEHSALSRKPLPLYGQMQYLRISIQMLLRLRKLYWLKSRKVSATWLLLVYLTWQLLRRRDRLAGWVTQKETDGKLLVERYVNDGIIPSLPDWLHGRYDFGKAAGTFLVDRYMGKPWKSRLIAYPKGADQLRQFGHSYVVIDEAHLMLDLEDLLQGISPGLRAAEGAEGGQLVLVFVGRRGAHVEKLCGKQLEEGRRLAMERLSVPPDLATAA